MPVHILQGPTKCIDGKITYDNAGSAPMDTNQGGDGLDTLIVTNAKGAYQVLFFLMLWDLSEVLAGESFATSDLTLNSTDLVTTVPSITIRRVVFTDFTELGMTWNSRVNGSLLFNTTTDPSTWISGNTVATNAIVYAGPGLHDIGPATIQGSDWDALVSDAITNRGKKLALVFYATDLTTDGQDMDYYSADYAVDTTKRPKLTVRTLGTGLGGTAARGRGRRRSDARLGLA